MYTSRHITANVTTEKRKHVCEWKECFTFFTGQMSQQGDGLDGLAQTHFISKNTVELFLIHGDQPVKSNVLVLS